MGIIRGLTNFLFHDRNSRIRSKETLSQIQETKSSVMNEVQALELQHKIDFLRDKTLHDHESGISTEHYCDQEVVVSLTTFGERIDTVHLAIESIMQGSMRPNHIILWLAEDEFNGKNLPRTLLQQQGRGLEIAYCNDLKSYNKLIHSLHKFPNAAIITIDDDIIYEYDLVERLVNTHINHPNAVCACRMHRIRLDNNKKQRSYLDWDLCIHDNIESPLNFPTGVGGVLYPPHCFNNEVLNSTVFMDLCPKADDIWFYAMARLNSTPAIWTKTTRPEGYYRKLFISDDSLCFYNTDPTLRGNDIQFDKVCKHYHINLAEY